MSVSDPKRKLSRRVLQPYCSGSITIGASSRSERHFLCRERFKFLVPEANDSVRPPNAAGHDRHVRHAGHRMDVNEGGAGGNGCVSWMKMGMACRRHGAEKADDQDCGDAERGFGQAVVLQAADGAGRAASRGVK